MIKLNDFVPIVSFPLELKNIIFNKLDHLTIEKVYQVSQAFYVWVKECTTGLNVKREVPLTKEVVDYMLGFPHLTSLCLNRHSGDTSRLPIEKFSRLTSLYLKHMKLTPEEIYQVSTLTKLSHFEWTCSSIDNCNISLSLCTQLTLLKTLTLSGIGVENWENAGFSKKLCSLSVKGSDVNAEDLHHFTQFSTLQTLNISDTNLVSESNVHYLAEFKHLTEINLSHTDFRLTDIVHLTGLQKLKSIVLDSVVQIYREELIEYPIVQLEELRLDRFKLTHEYLSRLSSLTALKTLGLNSSSITEEQLAGLSRLTNLTFMNLGGTKVSNVESWCFAFPNMIQLFLQACTSVKNISYILQGCPKLRLLDMESTGVEDRDLEKISEHYYLTSLNLNRTKITDECFKYLVRLKNLTKFQAKGTEVSKNLL